MDAILTLILIILMVAVLGILLFRSRGNGSTVSIQSSLEGIRSVGELSVFKAYTKEIVTEVDHSWGELGRKYLDWIYSSKKMAMIFEFELDFRYDLRHQDFDIIDDDRGNFTIQMPACSYDVNIRSIEFYDEQHSKLLPWLLPDLVNGFLGGGFTEDHRNRLVTAARTHAEEQARQLITDLSSDVEASAQQTLRALGKAFGADQLKFEFRPNRTGNLEVNVDSLIKQAA